MKKEKTLFTIVLIICFFYSCKEKAEPTGWWKINLSKDNDEEISSQPWGIGDTTIVKIEQGVMEVLDGIDFPPFFYYGNHCPLYLNDESFSVFNLHNRIWQKFDVVNSSANLIQIKDESGRIIDLQRIPPYASITNSNIQIDSIRMVISEDSLANKENPIVDELDFNFINKTYATKSFSIYKLSETQEIVEPLSETDIDYITVLFQRVFNGPLKDLRFEQKVSDSPKTVVEVYYSNEKLTIEAGDPISIPKPVAFLIKYLERFK